MALMNRSSRQFKETQVFNWDIEPKDERPSEFLPSTGYSVLSGFYTLPDSAVPKRQRRSGISGVLVAALVAIGLGAGALVGLLHMLKA
jgi:hypothetical protein